jgi:SAM-dependent methyltransferase
MSWSWDETLYAGSAAHYGRGRMPYPKVLAEAIRDELGLDGTGRLLDVGCGPGSLTTLLAPCFAYAIGVDADGDMIAEAARQPTGNVEWRQLRAEELPAGLGTFRAVTFAQSFHWMDQPVVAERVRGMIEPGGAWVHVHATTHQGVESEFWPVIGGLVSEYLGPVRRAGQGTLVTPRSGEEDVMRAAGFGGPTRLEIARGEVVDRSLDEIVAAVFSLSSSAPHLFGDRLGAFERDLRTRLLEASPSGTFPERTRGIEVVIWYADRCSDGPAVRPGW